MTEEEKLEDAVDDAADRLRDARDDGRSSDVIIRLTADYTRAMRKLLEFRVRQDDERS